MSQQRRALLTGWIAAALVAGSVLAVDPWGWAPFGPLKWALIGSLGLALVATAAAPRAAVHRASAVWWLVFVLWGMLASAYAVDPLHTWVGTPDRHLGLLTWALFGGVFLAGQTLSGRSLVTVLRAPGVALFGAGCYVILELVDLAPVELATTSPRAGGPFGSPAYLAAALVLLIPIAVGHAADASDDPRWRRVSAVGAALGAFAAFAAQTRAGWVGLAASGLVAAPVAMRWLRGRPWRGVAVAAALVAALALTPAGSRLAGGFDFEDGAARGRIDEWQVGVAVLANHPVLGVGFEGYRVVFAEGVDADYEQRYGRDVMPDRAHNGTLDVAVTTGVPGLALYAIALVWFGGLVVRATRRRLRWEIGVAAGVAGYLVQQQFLFPLAEVDVVFWLFAGVLVAAAPERKGEVRIHAAVAVVAAAFAAAALTAGVLDVAADHAAAAALDASAAGRFEDAADAADGAVDLRPDSIRYRFLAATVKNAAGTVAAQTDALADLDAALDVSPRDPILLAEHASIRLARARAARDPAELAAAIEEWEALVATDPNHGRYRLELGIAYRIAGRPDAAAASWRTAAFLAPGSAAPHVNLALLALEHGDVEGAAAAIEALRSVAPDDARLMALERQLAALRSGEGA